MSRNIKLNCKALKTKMSKSLSRTKCDQITHTVESISTPINTVESLRKPFVNLKTGHIPFNNKLTITPKPKPNSKQKNNRTTVGSPNKTEAITKLKEEIIEKDKALILKDIEINQLKELLKIRDSNINSLQKEITFIKENKQEENEYEEYSKKLLVRNLKALNIENIELKEEVNLYKKKEMTLMQVLYNMKQKGISVETMIECAEKGNGMNKEDNPLTEKSEKSDMSSIFTPLILNTEDNFTVKPSMIPKLNLTQLNDYNEDHYSILPKQTHTNTNINTQATSGASNHTSAVSGHSNNSHSHDQIPQNQVKAIKLNNHNNLHLKSLVLQKKKK